MVRGSSSWKSLLLSNNNDGPCHLKCVILFFKLHCYIFTYFWLHWVFVAACGLSLVAVSGGSSLVVVCGLL